MEDHINLKKNIEDCVINLQKLVNVYCWNNISSNFVFIVSDFNEIERTNFFRQRKTRNKINKSKKLLGLDSAVAILSKVYLDLYDINLYVYKADKKETVIEIQYYRKSNFEYDYFETIKDNLPMFHAKIAKPYYVKDDEKFDVNWELQGSIAPIWKNFCYKFQYSMTKLKSPFLLNFQNKER